MKEIHWSVLDVNYITLEIPYDDGCVQGWDYDCSVYVSRDAVKTNMAADFVDPRMDRQNVSVYFKKGDEYYSTTIELTDEVGDDFVDLIFSAIDEVLSGY